MNMLRGRNTVKIITPPDYLCFTANTAGSTIRLDKHESPTSISLETSTDGVNWTSYPDWSSGSGTKVGTTITLSNIGDKVYWRNTSTTTTGFSTSASNYYQFVMTGSMAGSGDINYLLGKDSTDALVSDYCYYRLFYNCTSLTTAPELLATTLAGYCYNNMFHGCINLTTTPSLPATTLAVSCYYSMLAGCSKIKLSTTQTGEYQTPYRIPSNGTGADTTGALYGMFTNTGGTFTGTPSINTTYYTSNTIV